MSVKSIYGSMLQEYNVSRIRQNYSEWCRKIDSLQNKADAESYIFEVRAKIASCFNMPERTAVPEVNITGKYDLPDCRLETVIYESRPGFPVTAHLLRPLQLNGAAPAMIFLCGHDQKGKNGETYSICARTLAANGYIVLSIDPAGQGERYLFTGANEAAGVAGKCTSEHNMVGKQLHLCGEFFGAWRAHDALCGLDYLLSLPEVDPSRVGITGNSGGGTMTSFVQALDPRFTMAAPSCYITSWKRNIENELPADIEQIPPGITGCGCEMGDLILAYAPRPIILLGQKKDFFDPRGLLETYEKCCKVYALLGAEDNLQCFIGPTNHGFSKENRFAMYGFFGEKANMPAVVEEVCGKGEFNCSESGQIYTENGVKNIHDIIVEKLDVFAAERKKHSFDELRNIFAEKLQLRSSIPVPYSRSLRIQRVDSGIPGTKKFSRFALESEPGILTIVKLMDNDGYYYFPERNNMTLYVPHLDSADELADFNGRGDIAGVDVRGLGESFSYNCDQDEELFFVPYGRDYHYESCEILFGSSMLAKRVRDLLTAVVWVKSCGVKEITVSGRGQGAIIAALGALLSDDIKGVKLFDAPESWDSMARSRITLWPQSSMLQGILSETDLPEVYEALAGKMPFEIVNHLDPLLRRN